MVSALVLVRLLVAGLLVLGPWTDTAAELEGWDVARFDQIADEPGRPWLDHEVEYPPGSVLLSELVGRGGLPAAHRAVVGLALAADLALAAAVARLGGRRALLLYLVIGTALLPTSYLRFDLAATLAAALAWLALRARRPAAFGLAVAVGFMVKLWPLALLGLAWSRRSAGAAFAAILGVGASMVGWVAYAGVDGPRQVLSYRGADGWQIESVPGVIIHLIAGGDVTLAEGAYRFGSVPGAVRLLLPTVAVLAWLAAWWRARPLTEGAAIIASVGGLMVMSTLLSPQFVVWLLPFVAVNASAKDRSEVTLAARLAAAAMVATGLLALLIHPEHADAPLAQVMLLARNILLVGAVGLNLVAARSAPTATRWPRPLRSG